MVDRLVIQVTDRTGRLVCPIMQVESATQRQRQDKENDEGERTPHQSGMSFANHIALGSQNTTA